MATSTKNTCIIHSEAEATDVHENLISLKTYDSWLTILEAAKVRNFLPVLEISENLNEKRSLQYFTIENVELYSA